MFTGLIEDIGTVKNISSSQIELDTKLDNIAKGDSISVNGVCLTAVNLNKSTFIADYSPSTDRITTLSRLKQNSKVNLERALKLSSRFGGHIVNGHVDGIAKIEKIEKLKEFYRVVFSCGKNISAYCVEKGSIAVDGISLTIASLLNSGFEVFIIPETFNNTIMQFKKVGDEVNIEADILAKYIEKFITNKTSGILLETLKGNGFI
ncbi:riboflavin synthase [Endomicrobiia bacterium]|nr:riboflavin synthase [Endomicrobiia bacterium]GHT69064.1 riboflavin synthase [Endomicrobiia bacterium]GHT76858.1 riboflavin synthase [Endomicrobiia bacterium]